MMLGLHTVLDIPLNISAVVARIRPSGEYYRCLMELGIRVGSEIRVIHREVNQPLMLASGDSYRD
ncbi:MAG: FeoA domain-containing protein [Candidatus Malihini olakiniferum]